MPLASFGGGGNYYRPAAPVQFGDRTGDAGPVVAAAASSGGTRGVSTGASQSVAAGPAATGLASSGAISSGTDIKNNTALVGLKVSTTHTDASGFNFDTVVSITGHPSFTGGSGTYASPYVIDRVLFAADAHVGGSGLAGKWLKFTNSRFYGNPGDPTPGGSFYLGNASGNAMGGFIVEDSTLGPNAAISGSGGPATGGGCDKGVQAFCPVEVRRCSVWGANINIYMQTEQTDQGSIIDSCWIHDTWSASGDHTDSINGNQHASNVTVQKCFIDGIRTGNSFVTNSFGIYDDPGTSAGIITNWTLDKNYVTRAATGILSNTSTSRFLSPFVVTNNVFDQFSLTRSACRTPSTQSGNVDGSGNPITF